MGELLSAQGFTEVEAADANSNYIRHCIVKGWYKKTYELYLGLPRTDSFNNPTIPEDLRGRFDCVVGCGVFYEGHIPAEGFVDAYDMLKTGGYFVTSLRKEQYWVKGDHFGYKDTLDRLV